MLTAFAREGKHKETTTVENFEKVFNNYRTVVKGLILWSYFFSSWFPTEKGTRFGQSRSSTRSYYWNEIRILGYHKQKQKRLKTTKFVHRWKWSRKRKNFFFRAKMISKKNKVEHEMHRCLSLSLPDLFHEGRGLVVGHLDSGDVWSGLQVDSVQLKVLVVQLSVHVVRHVSQVTDHRAHLKCFYFYFIYSIVNAIKLCQITK